MQLSLRTCACQMTNVSQLVFWTNEAHYVCGDSGRKIDVFCMRRIGLERVRRGTHSCQNIATKGSENPKPTKPRYFARNEPLLAKPNGRC